MPKHKKLSLPALREKARSRAPLSMITCYDYSMAHWVEEAGIDLILVGDSLGMTMLGYDSTLPVTMDDMIRHGSAVRRGAPDTFLVVDMPYMSYQISVEEAVRNAGRLMAETGCDAVKLEGGRPVLAAVRAMVSAGIPVMGHLGLTPQSAASLGGFRLQGKTVAAAQTIAEDAGALEDAGAFLLLLELVPAQLCRVITERSSTAVIGLGSGPFSHGQLLIFHDLFGLYPKFKPRMAKRYVDVGAALVEGLRDYAREVRAGEFPQPENYFSMDDEECNRLNDRLAARR